MEVLYPIEGDTIPIVFDTFDGGTGASITMSGLAVTDIEVYKDVSMTQRASDNGYALIDTDGIDIDGITGIHGFSIDLSDNSDASFYTIGPWYTVIVSSITVDGQTVNFVAAKFRIQSATRGMAGTALPDAAADAAGGLPISDAGGLDLDTLNSNVSAIKTKTDNLTFTTSNKVDARVDYVGSNAVTTPNDFKADVSGLATSSALATAQNDLDIITGTDGVTLATSQANYAPATATALASLVTTVGSAGAGLTEAGGTGDHLTAIPWNASWDAEVQSEVNDGLVTYNAVATTDLPTNFSSLDIDAAGGVIPQGTVSGAVNDATPTTDTFETDQTYVANELRDRVLRWTSGVNAGKTFPITSNTTTAITIAEGVTGIATGQEYQVIGDSHVHSLDSIVNAVWTATTGDYATPGETGEALDYLRTLAPTISTLTAANILTQASAALVAIHLDHIFAAAYDPASKPGDAAGLLNVLVENDSGVPRYTVNSLENAPSGSGASAEAIADAVWDEALSGHVTAGSAGAALSTAGSGASASTIADAVCDEALSGHSTAGTLGKALSDILASTNTLGSATVTVTIPVSTDGTKIVLVQGDDYAAADGRALSFSSTGWPDLTGAAIKFACALGDSTLSVTGELVSVGGATQVVRAALTAANTGSLNVTTSGLYKYDVQATLSGGNIVTLVRGKLQVLEDYAT